MPRRFVLRIELLAFTSPLSAKPGPDERVSTCSFSQLTSPHSWCLWVRSLKYKKCDILLTQKQEPHGCPGHCRLCPDELGLQSLGHVCHRGSRRGGRREGEYQRNNVSVTILLKQVTSLLGWQIPHVVRDDARKESYRNRYGVLVTGRSFEEKCGVSHEQFVRQRLVPQPEIVALLQEAGVHPPGGEKMAVDLLRDISSGEVITAAQLGRLLGVSGVTSYYALEADAVRYKQSEACRLRTNNGHTAFLKRIVLRELPSAAVKARWVEDVGTSPNLLNAGLIRSSWQEMCRQI